MSKATKNAHDWHCEDHDTFGWRGESCSQCPTAPSEIESLRQQLASRDAEVAELNKQVTLLRDAVKDYAQFRPTDMSRKALAATADLERRVIRLAATTKNRTDNLQKKQGNAAVAPAPTFKDCDA